MLLNCFVLLTLALVVVIIIKGFVGHKTVKNADKSFLQKKSTDSLKGLSIIMIVFSHICQYEPLLENDLFGGRITYTLLLSGGAIGVSLFFLLSGYGCFLSINKTTKYGKWLITHIVKTVIHFIVVYILVVGVIVFVFKIHLRPIDCLLYLITIRLPGSTVWYLKIQIVFYIILTLSQCISRQKTCLLITVFSLLYAVIACFILGLPDYWWKTSMCFAMGCYLAKYRINVERLFSRHARYIVFIVIGCVSFFLLLKDTNFNFFVEILGYLLLAFSITVVWNWFGGSNGALQLLAKYSLDIYLVHIGLVEYVFGTVFGFSIKLLIFLAATFLMTFLCYQSAEYINKRVNLLLQKK